MNRNPDPISREATLTLIEQLSEATEDAIQTLYAAVEHLPIAPAISPDYLLDTRRQALIAALQRMPEEAFTWFAAWAQGQRVQYPSLSGFTEASRASIEQLRAAADAYLLPRVKPGGE